MEDIIDIIVTETTNLIEITSQPTDEIIDVNIIDNREDVTLNVTPSVVEININSLTGNFGVTWGEITGTLSSQTDLQTVLNAKADLVDGKVPSSQLPSYVDDVVEVANYASLPVTGEVGKIYITLDTNFIYRWSGSTYIEIKDSSAVWGAITGTLSSQTDLQSALNAKVPYTGATGNVNLGEYGATVGYLGFDTTPSGTPTGIGTMYWDSANRTVSLIDGDGDTTLQIGQEERVLVHNNTGSTLTDGQVVYVTGSTGELPSVALASNTTEATSSVTFGIVTESIANGADGFVTTSGIVHGLNTNAFTEGAALYLGSTAGTFTETKPIAPANSVLVGYIIKKSGGNGSIFVKIQNGYELEELHDVLITSKANNDGLFYESSTSLWKNKSIATVLGYTPANDASVVKLTGSQSIAGDKRFLDNAIFDFGIGLRTPAGLYQYFEALNGGGYRLGVVTAEHDFYFSTANNYSYTFPAASGTIALTSNLSSYLPLSGGTLTGALSGTSATFSGIIAANSQTTASNGSINVESSDPAIRFRVTGGTANNRIYEWRAVAAGGVNDIMQLRLWNDAQSSASTLFSVASNGAATFSSSVTATQLFANNSNGTGVVNAYSGTSVGTYIAKSQSATANFTTTGVSYPRGLGFGAIIGQSNTTDIPVNNSAWSNSFGGNIGFWSDIHYGVEGGTNSVGYNAVIRGSGDSSSFGFFADLSGAVGANRYGIYTKGEAKNYFSGNVGIGTTSPDSKLNITGGSTRGLRIDTDSGVQGFSMSPNSIFGIDEPGVGNGRFVINTNGRVGIGTGSPSARVSIASDQSSNNQFLNFVGTQSGYSQEWGFGIPTNTKDFRLYDYTTGLEKVRIKSAGEMTFSSYNGNTNLLFSMYGGDTFNTLNNGSGTPMYFNYIGNGAIKAGSAGNTTLYAGSDIRIKENIEIVESILDKVMNLTPKTYNYKDIKDDKLYYGFIAQEMEEVFPELVRTSEGITMCNDEPIENQKSIESFSLVWASILTKAVQELKAELDTLKNK